jgi:hypothetical protein
VLLLELELGLVLEDSLLEFLVLAVVLQRPEEELLLEFLHPGLGGLDLLLHELLDLFGHSSELLSDHSADLLLGQREVLRQFALILIIVLHGVFESELVDVGAVLD